MARSARKAAGSAEAEQRLLRAILNLQYFSAKDLAHQAGTSEREAAALLDSTDFVESLTKPLLVNGPGGGVRTHRLRENQVEALAEKLAGVVRPRPGGEVVQSPPSLLSLAETAVGDLAAGGVPTARFEVELKLAERQWLGAQASLRDRLATDGEIEKDESGRLSVLKATLERLRSTGPAPLPLPQDVPATQAAVRRPLVDWTAPVSAVPACEGRRRFLARHTPAALSSSLFATDLKRSVFWPAAALATLWPDMTHDYRAATTRQLAAEVRALDPGREVRQLVARAIAAAMVDDDEAAEPLFIALLGAVGREEIGAEPLDLCCAALARLARPQAKGSPRQIEAAVLGCHYLCNGCRTIPEKSRARLCLALVEAPELVAAPPPPKVWAYLKTAVAAGDGAASCRNLGVGLAKGGLAQFPEYLASYPVGSGMFSQLAATETKALVLDYQRDAPSKGEFEVYAAEPIRAALSMGDQYQVLPDERIGDCRPEIVTIIDRERQIRRSRGNVFLRLRQQAGPESRQLLQ